MRLPALGASLFATTLVVLPATAQSDSQGTSAAAAKRPAPAAAAVTVRQPSRLQIRSARRNVSAGRRTLVRGTLAPHRRGGKVALQTRKGSRRWTTVSRGRTRPDGSFRLRYTPKQPGTWRIRVRSAGNAGSKAVVRRAGRLNVFRRAFASWYGPGLYGAALACGGRLSPGTLGVAHKTLPCGTKVTLRYNGRSVRVPVVDRGPYVGGRDFDLTAATKRRLGFGSTGSVQSTR